MEAIKPKFCTVDQACKILQLSRPSIYNLFKSGKLTPIKFNSSTRIRLSEIKKFK